MNLRQFKTKLISLVMVFTLLFSVSATTINAAANAVEPALVNEETKEDLIYVSLGDSTTNGYGLTGYEFEQAVVEAMKESLYADHPDYSGEQTLENPNGLLMETPGAYPALFKNYLQLKNPDKNVNLIQLAISAMRADDALTMLTIGTDEHFDIDDYSGNKFNDKYVIHNYSDVAAELPFDWEFDLDDAEASMGKLYQESVKAADVVSVNLGSNNFSIYLWGCIGPMLMGMMGGDSEAGYVPMMDELLATVNNEELAKVTKQVYAEIKTLLMEKIADYIDSEFLVSAVDNIADYGAYTFLSYCISYTKLIDRIHQLNPDTDIILIPPVNFMKGFSIDLGDGNKIDMSEFISYILDAANTYVFSMAAAKDVAYENEIFWADHGGMVDMLMAEMVELEAINFEGAEVLHSRMINSLIDWVATLSGGAFDLNSAGKVTREAVVAYKASDISYFVNNHSAAGMEAMVGYIAYVGAYVGMEKALIASSQMDAVDVNLFMDIIGGNFTSKVGEVFGAVGATVGTNAAIGGAELAGGNYAAPTLFGIGNDVADILNGNETSQGMLYVMAYFMIADGVVCHPSAKGYKTVANAMINAYENGYTTFDESVENLLDAAGALKDAVVENSDALYQQFVESFVTVVGSYSIDAAQVCRDWLYDNSETVIAGFAQYGDAIIDFISEKRDNIFNVLAYVTATYSEEIVDFVLFNVDVISSFVEWNKLHGDYSFELVALYIETVVQYYGIDDAIFAVMHNAYNEVVTLLGDIVANINNGVYTQDDLAEALKNLELAVENLKAYFTGALADKLDGLKNFVELVDHFFGDAKAEIITNLKLLESQIKNFVDLAEETKAELIAKIATLKDMMINYAEYTAAEILAQLASLENQIKAELASIAYSVKAEIINRVETIRAMVEGFVGNVYAEALEAIEALEAQIRYIVGLAEETKAELLAKTAALKAMIADYVNYTVAEVLQALADLEAAVNAAIIDLAADVKARVAYKLEIVRAMVESYVGGAISEAIRVLAAIESNVNALVSLAGEVKAEIAAKIASLKATLLGLEDLGAATAEQIFAQLAELENYVLAAIKSAPGAVKAQIEYQLSVLRASVEECVYAKLAPIVKTVADIKAAIENLIGLSEATKQALLAELAAIDNILANYSDYTVEAILSSIAALDSAFKTILANVSEDVKIALLLQIDLLKNAVQSSLSVVYENTLAILGSLEQSIVEALKNVSAGVKAEILLQIETLRTMILNIGVYSIDDIIAQIRVIDDAVKSALVNASETVKAEIFATLTALENALMGYAENLKADALAQLYAVEDMIISAIKNVSDAAKAKILAELEALKEMVLDYGRYTKAQLVAQLERLGEALKAAGIEVGNYIYSEITKAIENAMKAEVAPFEDPYYVALNGGSAGYAELVADALELTNFDLMTWDDIDYEALAEAGLITIGFDENELTTFAIEQILGFVNDYIDVDLRNNTVNYANNLIDAIVLSVGEIIKIGDNPIVGENTANGFRADVIPMVNGIFDALVTDGELPEELGLDDETALVVALAAGFISGRDAQTLDWAALVGAENLHYVDEVRLSIREKLMASGAPETISYAIPVAQYVYPTVMETLYGAIDGLKDIPYMLDTYNALKAQIDAITLEVFEAMLGESAYYVVEIPVADTLVFAAESYVYGVLEFFVEYNNVLNFIRTYNSDAAVVLLSAYNAFNMELEIGGSIVNLGDAYGYVTKLLSVQPMAYALLAPNVGYADITDAQTFYASYVEEGFFGNSAIEFLVFYFLDNTMTDTSEVGDFYIYQQIMNALKLVECEHEYDNACDEYCNVCGEWRVVGNHVYDNACDADCNECGEVREVPDHVYDNVCDAYCNECDAVREVPGHVYDNACDTTCNVCGAEDLTRGHVYDDEFDAFCNECGYERPIDTPVVPDEPEQPCDHEYDNACDADCNNCGEEREVPNHVYDNACDAYCNECGERRAASHRYSNSCDTTCNVCGATRTISHRYSNACDANCNVCGFEREVPDHKYDNACDANCNVCDAVREVPDHEYDNACDTTCNVCGAEDLTRGHVYDNACDADCNNCGEVRVPADHVYDDCEDADCNVCGFEREVTGHVYDNACDANCNACGFEREVPGHVYDNACDTTCNVCGATIPGGHVYDDCEDADCNVCGESRVAPGHVYDDENDTTCNNCDYVRPSVNPEEPCVHEYDNSCDADCNKCGEVRVPADHVYDDCEDAICNVCGEERVAPGHVYDDENDTTCNNCDYVRPPVNPEEPCVHEYDNACDADCNKCGEERVPADHEYDNACDKTCNVCGFEREVPGHVYDNACDTTCNVCGATIPGGHVYDNACDADCNNCGKVRAPADHVYDDEKDATCNVCGAERTIDDSLSVGAIVGISVGSAALAGAGGFSIFWFGVKHSTFAALGAVCKKKFSKTAIKAFFKNLFKIK